VDTIEAWRRSGNRKCSCERCFYCDKQLDHHEHDHYPVPRRARGSHVVAACPPCHDLKDRIFLNNWDIGAAFGAWHELFEGLSATTLNMLDPAKLSGSEMFALCSSELETRWASLSPLARIFYAKMRCLHEDDLCLQTHRSGSETSTGG
jgi:hypothetical protein